jgi:hypothetical protein
MRHAGRFLFFIGAIALGVLGCRAPQPNLKPPEEEEVLRTPDPNDKRYNDYAEYPPDVLASDPIKKALNSQNAIQPIKGPKPFTPGTTNPVY